MERGFTLLEMVRVLFILGVLAAVAVPRLSLQTGLEGRSAATDLVVALRGVQLHAMNGVPQARLEVDGSGWEARYADGPLRLPGGGSSGEWPSSVNVTHADCAGGRIGFDGLGSPSCDGTELGPADEALRFRFVTADGTQTVCLYPQTGYTERQPGAAGCGR